MTKEVLRRYLALFLPLLPAERISRARPPDAPFALVEKVRGAMRIAALDRAALSLGLEPGLTLADARARVPELIAFDFDPHGDAACLDWLADACDRYTPIVATDSPDGLVLDITGCTHRFGGIESALAADLVARLARIGLTARHAIAASPDAACALARHGGNDLHALPVTAIRTGTDIHLALKRAGLRTIGDLAALPPAPLAARFGTDLPVLLDRILAREDVRIASRRVPPPISVEARFAEPVARTEDVLATLTQLIGEAVVALSERGEGGRGFAAALFRSDGHVARLTIETAQPARDVQILDRLFRERIDTLADPLDPGFGYDLIRLDIVATDPLSPTQLRLDGGKVAQAEMVALIDRLTVRLGRGRVRRFAPVDTHIPEQQVLELPVADAPKVSTWAKPDVCEPPLRPFHLFDPPHRIEVIAEVPDGPPRRFKWRRALHEVSRHEGPERIAAEWWQRADGAGLTRDYYRVEDVRGRRFWLFRHGLYGREKPHPEWYLHGLFA